MRLSIFTPSIISIIAGVILSSTSAQSAPIKVCFKVGYGFQYITEVPNKKYMRSDAKACSGSAVFELADASKGTKGTPIIGGKVTIKTASGKYLRVFKGRLMVTAYDTKRPHECGFDMRSPDPSQKSKTQIQTSINVMLTHFIKEVKILSLNPQKKIWLSAEKVPARIRKGLTPTLEQLLKSKSLIPNNLNTFSIVTLTSAKAVNKVAIKMPKPAPACSIIDHLENSFKKRLSPQALKEYQKIMDLKGQASRLKASSAEFIKFCRQK